MAVDRGPDARKRIITPYWMTAGRNFASSGGHCEPRLSSAYGTGSASSR